MITLKIMEVGHTIDIPGLRIVRSPVKLDISKVGISNALMYLKKCGIERYEIISENSKEEKETFIQKDFDGFKKQKTEITKDDTKISKLENMIEFLLSRELSKSSINKEQINNKLDKLEKMVKRGIQVVDKSSARKSILEGDEPEIEEIDSFIPEVDVSDMKLNSDNIKIVKQDSNDNEESSDVLSDLIRNY